MTSGIIQILVSNGPAFKVMGEFLGYARIFMMTHEIFEKSLVYYIGRPDLMRVNRVKLEKVDPDTPVCWEGQLGGFEAERIERFK